MAKKDITISVDVPDGFEATGEWRKAQNGDYYIGWPGKEAKWLLGPESPVEVFILRKVEPVRESRWGWAYASFVTREAYLAAFRAVEVADRIPVRFELENGVPVSVALEPAEGGGA